MFEYPLKPYFTVPEIADFVKGCGARHCKIYLLPGDLVRVLVNMSIESYSRLYIMQELLTRFKPSAITVELVLVEEFLNNENSYF